jgi:hypothetical protein
MLNTVPMLLTHMRVVRRSSPGFMIISPSCKIGFIEKGNDHNLQNPKQSPAPFYFPVAITSQQQQNFFVTRL